MTFGDSLVNLASIEAITQESRDFNRVECQTLGNGEF